MGSEFLEFRDNAIKFAQVNLQKSRINTQDFIQVINSNNIDIALIQEPYLYLNKFSHLSPDFNIIYQQDSSKINTAIIISKRIQTIFIHHLSYSNITVVKVVINQIEYGIISVYFPPKEDIKVEIMRLQNIIDNVGTEKILIGGDINGKSPLWFSKDRNERGTEFEEVLQKNKLVTLNKGGFPYTYDSIHGCDNIDITAVTDEIFNKTNNWRVELGISDHNTIRWEWEEDIQVEIKRTRMHKGIRDWVKIGKDISRLIEDGNNVGKTIDDRIKSLNDIIANRCRVGRNYDENGKKRRKIPIWWWDDELTQKKSEVKRMNRKYRRCCDCKMRDVYKNEYKNYRREYKGMIRKNMYNKWEEFLREESKKGVWNIPDKVIRNKLKKGEIISTMEIDGKFTTGLEETYKELMYYLLPPDTRKEDIKEVIVKRVLQPMDDKEIITKKEITDVVMKCGNNKAPGIDQITAEVIKNVWIYIEKEVINIINECYKEGIFPDIWKTARLVVLYKGGNKQRNKPGSYRPVCLLSVLSKIYERIVLNRISDAVEKRLSHWQYGFRAGKSTEMAIERLLRIIQCSEEEYVICIMIDISNAFSSLLTDKAKRQISSLDITDREMNVLYNYLENRKIIFDGLNVKIVMESNRGCPQGSVLGPTIWNLVFDTYLRVEKEEGVERIAYADDCVIVIAGNKRRELEDKADKEMRKLEAWMEENNLIISVNKTEAILIKGKLKREPTVKYKGKTIAFKKQVKYLGIILDDKKTFIPHIKNTTEKIKVLFLQMNNRIFKNVNYGVKALNILYQALFLNVLRYGSVVLEDRIDHSLVNRMLRASQRQVLISTNNLSSTMSFTAMVILNKTVPIDYYLTNQNIIFRLKNWNCIIIFREDKYRSFIDDDRKWVEINDRDIIGIKAVKKMLHEKSVERWIMEWEASDKDTELKKYITDTKGWYNSKNNLNKSMKEIITGHCQIKRYLKRIGKRDEEICECGDGIQSVEHLMYICDIFTEEREELKKRLMEIDEEWPLKTYNVYDEEVYYHIKKFIDEFYNVIKTINYDF